MFLNGIITMWNVIKAKGENVHGVLLASKMWMTKKQYKDFWCQKANRDSIPTNVLNFETWKMARPLCTSLEKSPGLGMLALSTLFTLWPFQYFVSKEQNSLLWHSIWEAYIWFNSFFVLHFHKIKKTGTYSFCLFVFKECMIQTNSKTKTENLNFKSNMWIRSIELLKWKCQYESKFVITFTYLITNLISAIYKLGK